MANASLMALLQNQDLASFVYKPNDDSDIKKCKAQDKIIINSSNSAILDGNIWQNDDFVFDDADLAKILDDMDTFPLMEQLVVNGPQCQQGSQHKSDNEFVDKANVTPQHNSGMSTLEALLTEPDCPSYHSPSTSPDLSVDFEVDEKELALVTVPGQADFDPRKHIFADEELKPLPLTKKTKKICVPEDKKDDRYWVRRTKNNVSAKRCREARRIKENQIAMRASFLEKENCKLKIELGKALRELEEIKKKYQ